MSARRITKSTVTTAIITALLLVALSLSGCGLLRTAGQAERESGSMTVAPDVAVSPPVDIGATKDSISSEEYALSAVPQSTAGGSGTDASTVPPADRLVVRTVDLRLKVEAVESVADQIRKAAEKRKGIIVDYQISTDEGVPVYRPYVEGSPLADGAALSGYITARVPADQLQSFTDEIAKMGKVVRQAENEQDVTQEHVDLEARLVNLRATEARLRTFFDDAKNVTEMLAVEQELTRVRGEIESLQAQIAYLERQAAMSTVTVELAGPIPIVEPAGEDWGFASALRQSLRGLVGTINALIIALGTLAPVIALGALGFFVIRAIVRKRRGTAGAQSQIAHSDANRDAIEDEPTPGAE